MAYMSVGFEACLLVACEWSSYCVFVADRTKKSASQDLF